MPKSAPKQTWSQYVSNSDVVAVVVCESLVVVEVGSEVEVEVEVVVLVEEA